MNTLPMTPIRSYPPSNRCSVTDRGEMITVTTCLRREMFERLEAHAKTQHVTKAALVRALIERYLKASAV